MNEPVCPNCKHPVSRHDEFFCMQTNCRCNHGRATAMALYERDLAREQLRCAMETLKDIHVSFGISDVGEMARMTLDEIAKIGGKNA